MASLNYQNRNVIFQSGSIKISSELSPYWNEIIEQRFTKSIEEGGFDWTAVGGNPLLQYPSGQNREQLQEIHIAKEAWNFIFGGERAYGGNLTAGPGHSGYGQFYAVDEMGEYIAGLDLIQINSQRRDDSNRNVGNVLGTIVHELLHESSNVNDAVEDMIVDIQSKSTGLSSDQLDELRGLAEHVIIQKMMLEFADKNGLKGYINATATNNYEKWLQDALDAFDSGVDATEMDDIIEAASRAPGLVTSNNINSVVYNDDGSVFAYINEQGDPVTVDKGYYTENMLNLYGKEKVDSNGNVTTGMTLGGTLRALGDWLGFDGQFGIQGGFAKDDEGSDNEPVDAAKPVVLDMDGDGIEVSLDYQASFDYDGDGFRERTAWVSADDAFLVIDLNADGSRGVGDGKIDQRKELVLSDWHDAEEGTDLQALAEAEDEFGNKLFDTNEDGKLTADDTSFGEFRVWQDLDQDGEVDSGEMRTLAEAGITEINLTYDNGLAYDDTSDDLIAGAASQAGAASFVMGGITHEGGVGDMVLAHDTQGWKRVELKDGGGNVIGYSIELEGDANLNYGLAIEDADGHFDMTALDLDGASGDARNNTLDAGGHTKAVTITGGEGNDIITGGWAGDMISGDVGADELRAGGGNDEVFFDAADTVVEGGEGDDTAISVEKNVYDASGTLTSAAADVTLNLEAAGFEAAYGGDGDDTLTTSATFETSVALNGGEGEDILTSGAGNDTLSGDAGDDVLTANAGDDTVIGGEGDDTLHGGDGNDFLLGDVGNDIINGDAGGDFIVGGTGDDTINGGAGDDNLDGGAGSDIISDGYGDDHINAGDGYDVITTGGGDDYVDAGSGNDVMTDSWGDDVFKGGEGDDILNMAAQAGKDIYYGGTGNDTVKLAGDAADYTWTYKESGGVGKGQYTIATSSNGVHSSLTDFLLIIQDVEHLEFDDQTVDLADVDVSQDNSDDYREITTLDGSGGAGDDTNNGSSGNDDLNLWAGDDILNGKNGDDILNGHSGSDEIYGGNGDDELYGAYGSDILVGGDGSDTIDGSTGNDTIIGDGKEESSDDELDETNVDNDGAADILNGGDGEDTILGGKGDDTIHGDDGADFVNGGIGDDVIYGDSGADQLYGADGADTIHGGLGDDYIVSDSGYSLEVTVHLLRFLAKGSESKSVTEDRVTEIEAGIYSVVDVVNSYLGGALGHTADGSEYPGTVLDAIADDELSFTDSEFLTAVLPRIYGRAATSDETTFWQVKLDNGAVYATIVMEAIDQAMVDPAKIQSAMVLFEEYTTAEATALSFDDIVNGDAGNDEIYAGKGDDTVTGGDGHDKLHGGSGDDSLTGGKGSDSLLGGMGDDTLIGGSGADVLEGGDGADIIHGDNAANDGDENPFDTLSYEGSDEGVTVHLLNGTASGGDAEGDTFDGIEWLAGSEYDDTLTGDAGDNRIFGNGGDDKIYAQDGADHLYGGGGNDYLNGEMGDDRIYGGEGADDLVGNWGDDLLVGGDGGDILTGAGGIDHLVGGNGADVFMLYHSGEDTVEDFTIGEDTIGLKAGVDFSNTTITLTQDGEDTLVSSGSSSIRLIGILATDLGSTSAEIEANFTLFKQGTSVSETLDYSASNSRVMVNGENWNDTIIGSDFNDIIDGGHGHDSMQGGLGDDTYIMDLSYWGGAHSNEIIDLSGVNTLRIVGSIQLDSIITENSGDDLKLTFGDTGKIVWIRDQWLDLDAPAVATMELSNGEIIDLRTFHDNGGDDTLTGTNGDDTIDGYIGNDEIDGGDGDDTLNGGEGNDRLIGGDGEDIINGGDGDDYIADGSGTGTMDGGDGVDTVDVSHTGLDADIDLVAETVDFEGSSPTETAANFENVVGTQGDNAIFGTDGSNILDGQDGNDTLTGGLDRDTLMGGAGDDTYIYNLGDGSDVIIEGDFGSHLSDAFGDDNNPISDDSGAHGGAYNPDHATAAEPEAGSDKILFGAGISQSDLTFSDIGDDLFIHLPDGATITIQDFVNQKVETLEFADGSTMDLTNRGDVDWLGNTSGTDNYFGGEGNDTLTARGGHDVVQGGGGNDVILGQDGDDTLYGGSGDDTINGDNDDDTIYGDRGDDHISGGWGVDHMDGGRGTDTVDYSSSLQGVDIDLSLGITALNGATIGQTEVIANFENAIGSSEDNIIIGTEGVNVIDGGAGDDTIEAGAGDDTLTGGTGANTYVFSRGDGIDTISDFNTNVDTIRIAGAATANITLQSIDYNGSSVLITYGEDADGNPVDQIILSGVPLSEFAYTDIDLVVNEIDGSASANVITGTDAHESIDANAGDDDITAGGGNDDIDAGAGADTVHAGTGNDKVIGGTGADLIYLEDGNDIFVDDTETGATGNDVVHGGEGDDLFLGDGGDDTFYGDEGNDTLNGGAGDDTLVGDSGTTNGKLIATYYRLSNTVDSVNDIPILTDPDGISIVDDLDVDTLATAIGGRADYYGVRYIGTINVTTAGDYTFEIGSDDGSTLWIDGVQVIDNDALQGLTYKSWVETGLSAGQHEIEIRYFEKTGGNTLEATVQGPDTGNVELDIFASGMLGDAAGSTNAPSNLGLEDILNGGAGDDILIGGSGADDLDGGDGIDTVSYSTAGSGVNASLLNTATNTGEARGDTYSHIENLLGSAFGDRLEGDANTNVINGAAGSDILNGGSGDDTFTGGSGADIIELDFGSGSDTMTDFEDGLDLIDLGATDLVFADLTIVDTGTGDTKISFDDGDAGTALDELTLTGITASDIDAADFQFG